MDTGQRRSWSENLRQTVIRASGRGDAAKMEHREPTQPVFSAAKLLWMVQYWWTLGTM